MVIKEGRSYLGLLTRDSTTTTGDYKEIMSSRFSAILQHRPRFWLRSVLPIGSSKIFCQISIFVCILFHVIFQSITLVLPCFFYVIAISYSTCIQYSTLFEILNSFYIATDSYSFVPLLDKFPFRFSFKLISISSAT